MSDETLGRIDALIAVALRIARSAPTGKITLARIADAIDLRWLPGARGQRIAAELADAREAASEPIEAARVERVLRDAWGVGASEELDELELDEPVAVTPGAQVHRGSLEGMPVAVKVLRPGLAASIRQDLTLLEGLLAPLAAAFPGLDARAVIAEVRERVLDELDLEHEAQVQRRFHRALRDHPFLTVPAPVTRLAHDDVLVSEWVEGVPLAQAPDRDDAAAKLVLFAIGAARGGMIHADPDPNDVLVTSDGHLAVLDFGATRAVDRGRVATATSAHEAFVMQDADSLGAALERLGWLPSRHAQAALELGHHALGDLAGPGAQRLDSDAVLAVGRRLFARPDALGELILAGALPPEDLWPARGLGQLFSTIARVGATGPWTELVRAALREGWDARPDSSFGR